MSRSYTFLRDKVYLPQRNRTHLIKMISNFVKTENDNDMDNDIEIEPKIRHSTSKVSLEMWANFNRRQLNFENIELHSWIRKKSNQIISI